MPAFTRAATRALPRDPSCASAATEGLRRRATDISACFGAAWPRSSRAPQPIAMRVLTQSDDHLWRGSMRRILYSLAIAAISAGLAACGETRGDRALSGAAI